MSNRDAKDDLCFWTPLFGRNTGLPCNIWVHEQAHAITASHPTSLPRIPTCSPTRYEAIARSATASIPAEYVHAIQKWRKLNEDALNAHWAGELDSAEFFARLQKLPQE